MRVFAPISQTGGVGKSTYAWNLAWVLAQKQPGARVLFVDATKSQGTRSMRISPESEHEGNGLGRALNRVFSVIQKGIPFHKQKDDLAEALDAGAKILMGSLVPVYGRTSGDLTLSMLPAASARLRGVIDEKWEEPERGTILGNLMEAVQDHFDYCIFDVTPDIGCKSVQSIMSIADAVVSIQSVKSEDAIQGVAQLVAACEDTNATLTGWVANLYSQRAESRRALRVLVDACSAASQPILALVTDRAVISNTTRVHRLESGAIASGIYMELEGAIAPSTISSLMSFERDLTTIASALLGESTPNIVAELQEDFA